MSLPAQLELFPPVRPAHQHPQTQPIPLAPHLLWPTLTPQQQQAVCQVYLQICQRLLTAATTTTPTKEATNE
jgi:hypothetical protein